MRTRRSTVGRASRVIARGPVGGTRPAGVAVAVRGAAVGGFPGAAGARAGRGTRPAGVAVAVRGAAVGGLPGAAGGRAGRRTRPAGVAVAVRRAAVGGLPGAAGARAGRCTRPAGVAMGAVAGTRGVRALVGWIVAFVTSAFRVLAGRERNDLRRRGT